MKFNWKKKTLALQVALGLMVAGQACLMTSSEANAETFTVDWDNGGWISGVVVGEGSQFGQNDISAYDEVIITSGGADATVYFGGESALTGKTVTINTDNQIGGNWAIFKTNEGVTNSGNVLNLTKCGTAWGGTIDAGSNNTINIGEIVQNYNDDGSMRAAADSTFKAGTINYNGSNKSVNTIALDTSAAGENAVINVNAADKFKALNAGETGTLAVNAAGVKSDSSTAKNLKIGADGFSADDLSALNLTLKDGGSLEVSGNDVTAYEGQGIYRNGVKVSGNNFKAGEVNSYGGDIEISGNNVAVTSLIQNGGTNYNKGAKLIVSGSNFTANKLEATGTDQSIEVSGKNAVVSESVSTNKLTISGDGTLKAGTVTITSEDGLEISSATDGDVLTASDITVGGKSLSEIDLNSANINKSTPSEGLFFDTWQMLSVEDNKIVSKATNISNNGAGGVKEQAKSLVETQIVGLSMINSGADLLTTAGFQNAADAASKSGKTMTPYVAMGYGAVRQNTGSYVDVKGFNLNAGFAKEIKTKNGKLMFGPMFEYGRGNYDSYLEDANNTTANGYSQYWGLGFMARQMNNSGVYFEGAIRGGRTTSEYQSSNVWAGHDVNYESKANYWGAQIGLGKVTDLGNGNSIDLYGKFIYSRQGSDTVNVGGKDLTFEAATSKRTRVGFRYSHATSNVRSIYAGLGWQYEFDGAANATVDGYSTPSPSIKGSTALLELGLMINPAQSPVSFDLGVTGWAGKQQGYTFNAKMLWTF